MENTSAKPNEKHAVIAGGAMGIGEGIVRCLIREGWSVTIVDRVAAKAQALADELTDIGYRATAEVADITDANDLRNLAAALHERLGAAGVHAIVNSVGVFDERRSLLKTDVESFRRMLNINVIGAFLLTQALEPLLAAGASVVHIGSINGIKAGVGLAAYKTSKAAMNMMVRCMALELAADPRRVRVNVVAPGWVDTEGERKVLAAHGGADLLGNPDSAKFIPLGRRQTSDEIGNTVAFLCSDRAVQMTGQIIYVDGGMCAQ
jgi:3-oxoacyl-[acyl-carrier protein] reductase